MCKVGTIIVTEMTQKNQSGISLICKGFLKELNFELFLEDANCQNDVGEGIPGGKSTSNFPEEEI